LRIFQKEGPTDSSRAKGEWWCNADLGSNSLSEQVRKDSGVCPLFAENVCFVLWNFASSVLRFRTSIQVASNQEVDDQCKY
jgi:hypothetical protein